MNSDRFTVVINSSVVQELQQAVDYYNDKRDLLGLKFYRLVITIFKSLEKNALLYQIKYKNIRCVKVKKFPYLIHFSVDESSKKVRVYALISSYKKPKNIFL